MKKIAVILAVLLTLGLLSTSCRSTKPPCDAYSSVEQPLEIEK